VKKQLNVNFHCRVGENHRALSYYKKGEKFFLSVYGIGEAALEGCVWFKCKCCLKALGKKS